jgi:hypothetical protein
MYVHDTPVQAQFADSLAVVERPAAWLSQAIKIKNRLLYRLYPRSDVRRV